MKGCTLVGSELFVEFLKFGSSGLVHCLKVSHSAFE